MVLTGVTCSVGGVFRSRREVRVQVPLGWGWNWAAGRLHVVWGGLILASALVVAQPSALRANGWEHAAIPFEALIWGLGDTAAETRARAAESLGHRGQREAVPFLLDALGGQTRAPQVRRAIYVALGRLGDAGGLPPLYRCLTEEQRVELRSDCVTAIATIGEAASLSKLLDTFERDEDPMVRQSVALSLGQFPQEPALKLLMSLVEEPQSGQLRQRAIIAMGESGRAEAVGTLLAALEKARDDGERALIVWSLGKIGDSAAQAPLSQLLARAKSIGPELRMAVAVALGAIRDGSSYPTLVALLADSEPNVRQAAILGLRGLGEPRAVAPLSQHYRELQEVVANLESIDRDGVERALSALRLQKEILRAVIDLEPKEGVAALLDGAAPRSLRRDSQAALKLAEHLYERRRVALHGLGYSGVGEAEVLLSGPAGLGDPDPRLRATAVRSLAVLGQPSAVARLLPSLQDTAPEVRWTAALALGRLGDRRAVAPLLQRLTDDHGEVRRQVALGLGYLGDNSVWKAVVKLANDDPAATVRAAASYAADLLEQVR